MTLTKNVSAVVASLVLVGTVLVVVRTLTLESRTVSYPLERFQAYLVADILAHALDRSPVVACKTSLVPSGSASVRETR